MPVSADLSNDLTSTILDSDQREMKNKIKRKLTLLEVNFGVAAKIYTIFYQ